MSGASAFAPALPERTRDLVFLAASPDPYPTYRALRDRSPVHWIAQRNTAVVSRYADCWEGLRAPERFSSAAQAGMDRVLLGADPPAHGPVRRLVAREFTASQSARWEGFVRKATRELLDAMAARGPVVDLVDGLAIPLPVGVVRELLQIDVSMASTFRSWTEALSAAGNARVRPADVTPIQRGLTAFADFLMREHLPACARSRGEGLVTHLLTADPATWERLTPERALSVVRFFVFAGIETTRHLIGNAVLAFHRQALWETLRDDPALLPPAVEEVIRFESPVQLIQRTVVSDTEWHGVPLPRGALVAFLLGSANRDERQFEEPDRFRLGRPETPPHLAFGAGTHFCLGSHLARLEARVALEELFARWPRLEIAEPLGSVALADTFTTRGPARLLVSLR